MSSLAPLLPIVDAGAQRHFRALAEARGLDPDNRWVGGYVAYEWEHIRHVFESYGLDFSAMHVLEFGCNFGASAIVLAALGARVSAVDIDADTLALAQANAAMYGLDARIDFVHVRDTRTMPFSDGAFDAVNCNSVLEYVPAQLLAGVQSEIDRILKPGGLIFITGTSNRIWPVEMHSRRWLVNYLPRCLDRIVGRGKNVERGVCPWTLRYGFGRYANVDYGENGRSFIEAKRRIGGSPWKLRVLKAINVALRPAGIWLGLVLPSLTVTLRKVAS